MTKHYLTDLELLECKVVSDDFYLLKAHFEKIEPDVTPGQFVEFRIRQAEGVLLRRPISIHDFDKQQSTISFLVRRVGNGTTILTSAKKGDKLDTIFPLGNGFDLSKAGDSPLLIGGGVGVAPLYLLGKAIAQQGGKPTFLFGARNAAGLLLTEQYQQIGDVNVTTEDGSVGVKGFVTNHPLFMREQLSKFTSVLECGPTPMMKAVAVKTAEAGIECYASLENMMACGIGVCLCCVTDTNEKGNLRVCADGPVFNTKELKW